MNDSQTMLAKERVSRLFRFVAEMQQLSSPPNLNFKNYAWKYALADLPKSKAVQLGKLAQGEDDVGDDFVLKLKKAGEKKDASGTIFEKFFDLHISLERESEKLELLVADGNLSSVSAGVEHPILLQKLNLEFVSETEELIIRETDRETELYLPALRKIGLSEGFISDWRLRLQNASAHPLSSDDTSRFFADLQIAIQQQASSQDGVAPDVTISRGAYLYLGPRTAAFTQAIDSYLEVLPNLEELPNSLSRIVGVEADSSSTIPDEPDLLLTMPSNPEQERVARRLAQTGAVLVQGPPGTGKTHTIANLVGHLLAQGKSVLVTSHASKALRVVRNMVIPELRPLCVSVLDQESDSREQLESAVKGIVHRLTNSDVDELETLAKGYRHRRQELKDSLAQIEHRLLQVRSQEYQPLRIGDESVHPARAAQLLIDPASSAHTWLPGPVLSGAELPLTPDEVRQLYKLNREVPLELEADLSQDLPPIEKLIPDYQFRELINKKKALHTDEIVGEEFWEHEEQDAKQLQRLLDTIDHAMAPISDGSAWILDCCRVSSLGGAHKQLWEDLLVAIETSSNQFATLERRKLATGAEMQCDLPLEEQQRTITEIINYLKNKGSITFWTYMNASWRKILGCARIHGSNQPKSVEDCEGILACIQLEILQQSLQNRWDRQMGAKGAPLWKDLGPVPHEMAFSYTAQIRACLNWHTSEWETCRKEMKECGLRWTSMVDRVSIDTGLYGELFRIRECVRKFLIPTIHSRRADLDSSVYDQRLKSQENLLLEYAPKDLGGILGRLKSATQQLDADAYARAWAWFTQLQSLEDPARRRNLLLSKLESSAPGWVEALREHRQPHDRADVPGDATIAWRFRQWTQQLEERNQEDPDQLQQEVLHVRSQLRLATAQYVENITWANQLRRTGVKQQQALVGWLDLMKKIGSGKGKRAPKLRQTAREKLAECRDAVPVWIMPLARVAENYHPGKSKFDVVILDEASQSDVTGLLAFALGKEVLVVGDNEQVSPDAVGMSYEKVEALISEHLYDIPNKELYDGKTSVYDLARQSFGGTIRLVEHFRCVPEIIAFSNRLCYQGEIQPLRDDSKTSLRPSVRLHNVQGGSYNRKVNRAEAEEVASLVISCCQQPEYKGKTFGVVSLVGEEQAQYIDKLLTTHLPLAEYHERRILCGNAAQFQGDERDVVFLSTVETSEDSGSLSLRRTEVFVKRYNVAASRAKDQLWVVTSLDPDQDLKPGDLREQLIRHAQDPKKTLAEVAEMNQQGRSYSEFSDIGQNRHISDILRDELDRGGYTAKTNYSIGNYTLDLIVESASGRVAIKCDGDREIAGERFKQAVDREAVLERLGWRFIRLRASQYYLNPKKTIQMVIRRLQLMGLEPLKEALGLNSEQVWAELHQRTLFKASQIRRTWSGEEPVDTSGIVSHSEVDIPVETFFSVEKFLSGRDTTEPVESDFLRLPPVAEPPLQPAVTPSLSVASEPVSVEPVKSEQPSEPAPKPKAAWRDLLNLTKRPAPSAGPDQPGPAPET
jgi:very-short-patch-repair endonuclease